MRLGRGRVEIQALGFVAAASTFAAWLLYGSPGSGLGGTIALATGSWGFPPLRTWHLKPIAEVFRNGIRCRAKLNWPARLRRAARTSKQHTEAAGVVLLDIWHVACALEPQKSS